MAGGMVDSQLTLNLFILVCPEKDVQAGKRSRPRHMRAAEVTWLVHLGGERAEGFPCSLTQGGQWRARSCSLSGDLWQGIRK